MSHAGAAAWVAVSVNSSGHRDAVVEALFGCGSQGILEDGGAVVTHFPPGTDRGWLLAEILAADPAATVQFAHAPAADWSEWRASVRSHRIGKLTITPPWLAAGGNPFEVVIDPAMAFGTGEHATTRGVIRLMQRLDRMPDLVADLGAGSAVLSVCAAKLGAKRVAAIELDADAIGNAEMNVLANGCAGIVHVLEGDASVLLPLVAPVGLILANIISSVLLDLIQLMHDSLVQGGCAILSGILHEERDLVLDATRATGWRVIAEDEEEGWWSVLIERQP